MQACTYVKQGRYINQTAKTNHQMGEMIYGFGFGNVIIWKLN